MSNNFRDSYEDNKRKRRFFREELRSSTNYIRFLEDFTERNGSFSTTTFSSESKRISQEEREKIENLGILFDCIQEYSDANYRLPTKVDCGEYYAIQHNGIGYLIGVDYEGEKNYYCVRLEEPEEDSLDYEFVMSTVKLPKTIEIDDKMDQLFSFIEALGDVPMIAVEHTIAKIHEKRRIDS